MINAKELRGYLGFILMSCLFVAIISSIYESLQEKMTDAEAKYYDDRLQLLLARNDLLDLDMQKSDLSEQIGAKIFLEKKVELPTGIIYQVATFGYGGRLVFLVLVIDEKIKDFLLVESKETPGIGDLFDNFAWLDQLKLAINANKSYDSVVGATITSKAIGEATRAVYVKHN